MITVLILVKEMKVNLVKCIKKNIANTHYGIFGSS